MSLPISGAIGRSGGVSAAIVKQAKSVNLKPVKRVVFKFDPFHPQVEETRYFLYHMSSKKVLTTSLQCSFKTEIACDRSAPSVTFKLEQFLLAHQQSKMAKHGKEGYSVKLLDTVYHQIPAFTDLFDEESFYVFVVCFVLSTFVLVFIASRFVTLRPIDW